MSHQSLRRRLEALRKVVANRPPAPSGLSVNEELGRLVPERDAGLAVVAKRMPLFDRHCDGCALSARDVTELDEDDRHVTEFDEDARDVTELDEDDRRSTELDEWVWFVGGFVKELWGTCGKCEAELEPYEPEWFRLSQDPSERQFWDEYRSLVASAVHEKWELERSFR